LVAVQVSHTEIAILEAETIARLSALERLRDKARDGGRAAMLASVEQMIAAEIRTLRKLRGAGEPAPATPHAGPTERAGKDSPEHPNS
jgi:ribosomal 50S subunit-associated protein YjgA (DUF615 family)